MPIADQSSALAGYALPQQDMTEGMNTNGMLALGNMLHSTYKRYQADRRWKEQVWLKNLRQFRGVYDNDVIIPKNRSRAYPRVTRAKVVTAVAKLMEMLFPTSDKNWALKPSENPQIDQDILNDAVQKLDPQLQGDDADEELTKLIYEVLDQRTKNMSGLIESQLREKYVWLVRQVIKSATMYGTGVLHGPFVKANAIQRPTRNLMTGQYELTTVQQYEPNFQFIPIWDFYPDLSAMSWDDCDGYFFRRVMNRAGLRKLADRPDFMGSQIKQYLVDHQNGNYEPTYFENEIKSLGSQKMPSGSNDKFEIMSYWGIVSGHMLKNTGMSQFADMAGEVAECNLWLIDNTVIKVTLNNYLTKLRPVHIFTYEEDDSSLLGDGIPSIMEDSQRSICAATRMMLDNSSATAGPMAEVNIDLLTDPGDSHDDALHAFKVFEREGTGAVAGIPAVRNITIDNHVPTLLEVIKQMKDFADEETSVQLANINSDSINSEAMRTTVGMSMLFGNSNTHLRDVVRNFDSFTASVIESMVQWNMQFNNSPTIMGDHDVVVRGSSALVARELQTQALDALAVGLKDDEKIYINTRNLLSERIRMHNLPLESIMNSEENIRAAQQQQQQQAQEQLDMSRQKTVAEVKQLLANAYASIAKGDTVQVQTAMQSFETIMTQLGMLNADDNQGSVQGNSDQNSGGEGQQSAMGGLPGVSAVSAGQVGGNFGDVAGLPGFSALGGAVPNGVQSAISYRTAPVSR